MSVTIKILFFAFALTCLASCKSTQIQSTPVAEAGLFKVTILYPNGDDKTFDMDYYRQKHMPMVSSFLGDNLKFYEIDKGVSGRTPNDKPPFAAIGYFFIKDVAEYSKAIGQHRDSIIGDFKNYTNIQPVIQISQITEISHNNPR